MNMSHSKVDRMSVWCNDYEHSTFKAFMSALLLIDPCWEKAERFDKAVLWCLVGEKTQLESLKVAYRTLDYSPKVVYLAQDFYVPPVSKWIFFKTPLNVRILHNWLKSQDFSEVSPDDESRKTNDGMHLERERDSSVVKKERWRYNKFKLQYWPNVSQYSDSADIIRIISILLRDWKTYQELPQTELPPELIALMLNDAEEEGNLLYQPTELKSIREVKPKDEEDKSWGFFKSLFNRFIS